MAGVTFQVIRILFFYFLISFFKFYFFIEVQLNYSVVLITAVQQSDSVILLSHFSRVRLCVTP